MKVLFVHPSYPSQFTRVAHVLAEREGWECACLVNQVFAAQIRQDDPPIPYFGFAELPEPEGCSYYLSSISEGVRRGKAVVECVGQLQEAERFDAVVGHACFGVNFFLPRVLDLAVVSYVELPGYNTVFARREYRAGYPHELIDASLRSLVYTSVVTSDVCVTPSRYARSLFPPELQPKVRVQMEGFRIPEPVADRAALRRELGLPEEGPIVGFAGRTLEAVRGFDVFVKVVKVLLQVRSGVHFLAIGDERTIYGNESTYLKERSFKDRVLADEGFAGHEILFRPFMPYERFVRHLQAMDVILFPVFEGAANWGLFEAMAAGLPVLAANRCYVPEAIVHGREGLLFDAEDVYGFAEAVLAVLDDPARFAHLGRNARRKVARRFSEEAAAGGYAAVVEEAVARRRTRRGRAAA